MASSHLSDRPAVADIRDSLAKPGIHEAWEGAYRTTENERFYELAFDELARLAPVGTTVLDAGCGTAVHSIRLARRGLEVHAVDFSESALQTAEKNVVAAGLEERVRIDRGDLTELPYADDQFPLAICWGVLMHVPDASRALSELARVTSPKGVLVIYEINAHSPEARLLRGLMPRFARHEIELRRTPAGFEHWTVTPSGPLMWRHTDGRWLVAEASTHGLRLRSRRAGQLSEQYARLRPRLLARQVHRLNRFWFSRVRRPAPALANLFVFEKDRRAGAGRVLAQPSEL